MPQKTIQGNEKLAEAIRQRRNELNLTIEEAASKAGIGTKTWCRYEAGQSIRADKYAGVCKALEWRIPLLTDNDQEAFSIEEYRNHPEWSSWIEEEHGKYAALSFVVGSDLLLSQLTEELSELASMPRGTHVGQLSFSWSADMLPKQYLMRYDYEFIYQFRATVKQFVEMAKSNSRMVAHTVLGELALYLVAKESEILEDMMTVHDKEFHGFTDWVFDIFGDEDILEALYSGWNLTVWGEYEFEHWTEQQFYMDDNV